MNIESNQPVRERCQALIKQLRLPEKFSQIVDDIYLPLSRIILDRKPDRPLLVSINGVQGSGKSTMTQFLKVMLEAELDAGVAVMSLDDFYLKRADRALLAEQVHPLLATRGVPGTHELNLLEQVLDSLFNHEPCRIPCFDKAADDRCASSKWIAVDDPVQVILFEGWCNNSPAQNENELSEPVNELERVYDADGIWRHHVNQQLKEYHRRIFDRTDLCVMLEPPDFGCVLQWRGLQEHKLRTSQTPPQDGKGMKQHVMDGAQLLHFIQHFERISRHTLLHLPQLADVIIPIAADHSLTGIRLKPE